MNNKELKEQLKKEMLDLCETNSSVMTYMECLMRKYENLQSKIDKAIEYIGTWIVDEYSIAIQDPKNKNFCSTDPEAVNKLLDILKEDK